MNKSNIPELIITPTLKHLGLYSLSAETLLTAICAHESKGGKYLRQLGCTGDKCAFGLYQIELKTADAIEHYLLRKSRTDPLRTEWFDILHSYLDKTIPPNLNLQHNHKYATSLCRLFFVRFKEPLPAHDDIEAIAKYWKKYYNTIKGKGTEAQFIKDYNWFMQNDKV